MFFVFLVFIRVFSILLLFSLSLILSIHSFSDFHSSVFDLFSLVFKSLEFCWGLTYHFLKSCDLFVYLIDICLSKFILIFIQWFLCSMDSGVCVIFGINQILKLAKFLCILFWVYLFLSFLLRFLSSFKFQPRLNLQMIEQW